MWSMAWYYKHGDQEMGPVGKADLQALIKAKKISGKTLVRSAEADQWRPLAEMVRKKPAAAASPPPPPQEDPSGTDSQVSPHAGPNKGATAEAESDTEQMSAVCSQCGRSFPHDQVLTYEGRVICAACKPMFVQKLKEGVSLPTLLNYAGFWIRFLAKMIDGIVLGITQWIIMIPFSMMIMSTSDFSQGQEPSAGFFALVGVQQLIGILIPAAYNTFFIGRFGATLGKMACQLRVVMPDGGQVSYLRALGRNFAELISAVILGIGYIMAGFDDEKRALHDRICSTRVVRK
jgi:uncharacterized RDD family membrane protein YckC